MTEQDGAQSSTKQRRSRKTTIANRQNGKQTSALQRPTTDDPEAWKAYWKAQGQSWRTEPEIDADRKKYLAERRAIVPEIEKGIYPFRDIKLNRADVEWLLATHDNGRGPVDWADGSQREREGLDLRGADLRQIDLHNLPLARLRGGLMAEEWRDATDEQRKMAGVLMQGTNLRRAHLERASFRWAYFENADLQWAELERANFRSAHLNGAHLNGAHLEGATLKDTILVEANFNGARLEKAHLDNAILINEKHIGPWLADIQWGDASLAAVEWSQVFMLGEEYQALNTQQHRMLKDKAIQIAEYEMAVRANRQLAVALQVQGLNEEASRFTYRAQNLERVVFRLQKKTSRFLFSLLLYLLTGYGYKPLRSFIAYLLVIIVFATAYFMIGRTVGPVLSPLGSIVFSMTSFHGRGFFPGGIGLDDPLTVLAALEAFIGLLIEVTFIATLTQRLFGK